MRIWLIVAGLLCASAAYAQELLSPSAFRDATTAAVRELAPDAEIAVKDALSFSVTAPGGEEFTMNLDFAYRRYQADPTQMATLIERWSRIAAFGPEQAAARDRIIAVLRDRATVENYGQAFASAPQPMRLVSRPFAGDLYEVLVFDSAESLQFITNVALEELGVGEDEAWALAPQNLPERLGPVVTEEVAPGLVVVGADSSIAPSALTDPNFCAAGDNAALLYLIPDREWYIVADPRRGANLPDMRDRMAAAGDTISRTVLACRNGRLVDFEGV